MRAAVGQKTMPDDLGLLLEPVAPKGLSGFQFIRITAEGMAHQRQVETAAFLRLPDVGQLVDEEALPAKGLTREIVRPAAAVGMEPDVAHRRHCRAPRLERPPFAKKQPNLRVIDSVAEDRVSHFDLSGREETV